MAKQLILSDIVQSIHNSTKKEKDILDLSAEIAPRLDPSMRDDRIWEGRCDDEASKIDLIKHIEQNMPNVPPIVRDFLTAPGLTELDYLRRSFAVLDSVDHLVGVRAHPDVPPKVGRWNDLYIRLLRNGRYNTVGKNRVAIIPAKYKPKHHLFSKFRIGRRLCFVDPIGPYKVKYCRISLLPSQNSPRWRVGVVPAPHHPDKAKHRKCRGNPRPQYDICHYYSDNDIDSFCSSLSEIEQKRNIPIAIFPEAALNWNFGGETLLNKFRDLSKNIYKNVEHGLQLLLLGHCGDSSVKFGGYNTITVIKRHGEIAWSQTKLQGYPLSDNTIKRDKLDLPLLNKPEAYYSERLNHPSSDPELTVADTPYGRFIIAICEDAAHINPSLNVAEQAEVTHLILPVLDKQLRADGWYHAKAKSLAVGNCITIVANSAFLERHKRLKNNKKIDDLVGVLLINKHHRHKPTVIKWDPKGTKMWVARII